MEDINLIDLKNNLITNLNNKSNMFYTSLQTLYEYVGKLVLKSEASTSCALQQTENVVFYYKLDKKIIREFEILNKFANQVKHRNPGLLGPKFDSSMSRNMINCYNDYIIELVKINLITNDFLLSLENLQMERTEIKVIAQKEPERFEESNAYKTISEKVELLNEKILNVTERKVEVIEGEKLLGFRRKYFLIGIGISMILAGFGIFSLTNVVSNASITNEMINPLTTTLEKANIDIKKISQHMVIEEYENGDIYKGDIENGFKSGNGLHSQPNGNYYLGEWLNDKPSGKGVLVTQDGIYSGSFLFGEKNGFGTQNNIMGDYYTGYWENGYEHGQGEYIYENGFKYIGEFKYGDFDGNGKFYGNTDGQNFTVEGKFSKNSTQIEGYMNYSDGTSYKGTFDNFILEGFGTLIYSNGVIIEGNFENFLLNGLVRVKLLNGIVANATYEKGNLISDFTTILTDSAIKTVLVEDGKGTIID